VETYTGVGGALRIEGNAAWQSWIHGAKQLFVSSTYEPHDISYRSYNNDVVVANGYFVFTTVSKSGDVTTQTGSLLDGCREDQRRLVDRQPALFADVLTG
jgi:hypothetical protein